MYFDEFFFFFFFFGGGGGGGGGEVRPPVPMGATAMPYLLLCLTFRIKHKGMRVERLPYAIGRYQAIPHEPDKGNPPNPNK